jgi:hypothetical protein
MCTVDVPTNDRCAAGSNNSALEEEEEEEEEKKANQLKLATLSWKILFSPCITILPSLQSLSGCVPNAILSCNSTCFVSNTCSRSQTFAATDKTVQPVHN